ncbi:hypothetical protein ENSA5_45480 [Enhygromyxa salina]|uniref:DUF2383 domain-containing protein n=2 Tax=Enhygromyxa salina TaxID=215803 RepID=A0A2S9XJK1_9BACT|nr:hypothetical protein ENSA5_45480 [Enhygromyxa salina]
MSTTKTDDINQLNSFLRGEISAVETYGQCIEKIDDPTLTAKLVQLKRSHEERTRKLAAKIRELGGKPSSGSGAWGSFAKLVEGGAKVFGKEAAIAALEEGEDHGRDDYRDDLDKLSSSVRPFIISEIKPAQERTHNELSRIKSSM